MQQELIPHLFRTTFSRITAVLCSHMGIEHMDAAEDIAGDTFLSALETWPFKGIPPNPTAWLYAVAKNKAKNYIRRQRLFTEKIEKQLQQAIPVDDDPDIDLSDQNITDSQLRMLFAICHPSLSPEVQIGLSLRILCGFGMDEIASAFLSGKDTIGKRISRAKEKLRAKKVAIVFPPAKEIRQRLEAVLITLYLLYNEGYYSESREPVLREDLCLEAMRLTHLLIDNEQTNLPEVNALFSLMCFHSSRFAARKNHYGDMILYEDQDESLWNEALIAKGVYFLHRASQGNRLSTYHLEAGIAYWHTIKADTTEKWESILLLYDRLLQVKYSPVAALNRAFAISKTKGMQEAIREAEKLQLTGNHYYYTLLGVLYMGIDHGKAMANLRMAHTLARTPTDRQSIQKKIEEL